jgi:spore maturation protein B
MVTDYLIPCLLLLVACVGLWKRENVYDAMITGGAEGLRLLLTIAPSLVVLLCAIEMFRASGALEQLTSLLSPVCDLFGLPAETLPLMLVRPFSGSAALAVGAELMAHYGVDSQIGRTAAVMLGSTETTFYTITVYFGAAGVKRTRHTLAAAVVADLTGFLCAALFTKML